MAASCATARAYQFFGGRIREFRRLGLFDRTGSRCARSEERGGQDDGQAHYS